MIQIEKKMIIKMIDAVEMKMPKFHGGPSSFQMLMKNISWTSDWISAKTNIVNRAAVTSRWNVAGFTMIK